MDGVSSTSFYSTLCMPNRRFWTASNSLAGAPLSASNGTVRICINPPFGCVLPLFLLCPPPLQTRQTLSAVLRCRGPATRRLDHAAAPCSTPQRFLTRPAKRTSHPAHNPVPQVPINAWVSFLVPLPPFDSNSRLPAPLLALVRPALRPISPGSRPSQDITDSPPRPNFAFRPVMRSSCLA